ncbi:hypothetical protein K8Z61_08455 [Nocardioides sp. TRM66260-LWL]|uniref:hypothetical protein n=1 Tax=Nocardioides sp. TRM66260-LWL TaxID=2874478 RepID=UPI001CC63F2E|nr:hypothetical protein [Nocardioides sp. TRM66260-LWL]MBZ5734528.1 hypothetical protein [Nocardioides sp. TRM66260-LWL]
MSGSDQQPPAEGPPPPGWQPPGWSVPPSSPPSSDPGQPYPGQPYPGQPYPGQPYPAQPPAWQPPVLQPGAIPLRPLGLGDLFNGAFAVLRRNAGATIGASVLVTAVAGVLPLIAAVATDPVLSSAGLLGPDPRVDDSMIAPLIALGGAVVVGLLLQAVGSTLVGGMIAQVAVGAARGRVVGLGEAWAQTRGRRLRLLGLVLLTLAAAVVGVVVAGVVIGLAIALLPVAAAVLVGVVTVVLAVVLVAFVYGRVLLLAVPVLMVEGLGVLASLRRSMALSKGGFWRLLGIAILTSLVAGIAGSVLAVPVSIVVQVIAASSPEHAVTALIVGQVISQLVQSALSSPFTGTVHSLLYVDQRIRREAYDVELLAGPSDAA